MTKRCCIALLVVLLLSLTGCRYRPPQFDEGSFAVAYAEGMVTDAVQNDAQTCLDRLILGGQVPQHTLISDVLPIYQVQQRNRQSILAFTGTWIALVTDESSIIQSLVVGKALYGAYQDAQYGVNTNRLIVRQALADGFNVTGILDAGAASPTLFLLVEKDALTYVVFNDDPLDGVQDWSAAYDYLPFGDWLKGVERYWQVVYEKGDPIYHGITWLSVEDFSVWRNR